VMSVSQVFSEAIERCFHNKSISSLFDIDKDKSLEN
jgi:phosphoribosylpyrophosphate synthetase